MGQTLSRHHGSKLNIFRVSVN